MGHRANYVLIEHSEPQIYHHRGGATAIPEVLLSGFARTRRYVRDLTPCTELLSDVWAEGGLLLDADQHRLLFWGGEGIQYEPYLRRAFLPVLRYLWPQWTVEWAVHGVADLADHLHIDRATVLTRETFEEGFRPNPVLSDEELSRYEGEGNVTIITIKRGDGRVLDYRSSLLPGTMLSVGPPLLDFLLSKGHPIVLPHERGIRDDAAGGAFFDLTAHEVWVWNPAVLDPRYIEALKQSWTGWRVNGHVDGLVHQVALSGRDASSIMVPADEAAADLVKELTKFATLSNVIVPVMTNDVPEGADPIEIASGFVATRAEMNSVEEFQQLLHRLFRSALEQRS